MMISEIKPKKNITLKYIGKNNLDGNFLNVFIDCRGVFREHLRTWVNKNGHLLFTPYCSQLHHMDSVMNRHVLVIIVV